MTAIPKFNTFWKKCGNFTKCKRHCADSKEKCYWCEKGNIEVKDE